MIAEDVDGVKGIVYDLDGTLVRLEVDWEAVAADVEKIYEEAEISIDGDDVWELLERAYENGLADAVEEAIARHERDGASQPRRLHPADHLADLDVPAAICSLNCEDACRRALEHHDLHDHVDVVIGRDTAGARKPDPEHLLAAVEALELDPEDVLFVGDSKSDEIAAQRAGTRFTYVGDGPTQL